MTGKDNQKADNQDGYTDRVSQIMNQFNLLLASKIAPISGNRTSARVNFGTRTSAQILKKFINFGTN